VSISEPHTSAVNVKFYVRTAGMAGSSGQLYHMSLLPPHVFLISFTEQVQCLSDTDERERTQDERATDGCIKDKIAQM